jgi:dephospho-CoA kinase
MKIVIGLTGNIATGKSAIMALAAERGARTIDADKVVHTLLATDQAVKAAIRAAFGDSIFDSDGNLVRGELGKLVFADAEALRRLEAIVHPATRQEITRQVSTSDATITVLEAILLLEGPLHELCDQIWVTTCSAETQLERLMTYRNMPEALARQRIVAQAPQADKIARADVVIDTNGAMDATVAQFEQAWRELKYA